MRKDAPYISALKKMKRLLWRRPEPHYKLTVKTANRGTRVLIVGVGAMGYKNALMLHELGYDVCGVCDLNIASMERVRQINEAVCFFPTVEAADPAQFDVVVVATRAGPRVELVTRLVEVGFRRILCEKPIVNTMAGVAAFRQLAGQSDLKICVHHLRRWSPDYQSIKMCIREGALGTVRSVTCYVKANGFGNIGSHYIDLILYLLEQPIERVHAWFDPKNQAGREIAHHDPCGVAMYRLGSGATFLLDVQHEGLYRGAQTLIQVECEYGAITVWERHGVWYEEDRRRGLRECHPFELALNVPILKGNERARLLDCIMTTLLHDQEDRSLLDACSAAEAILAAQRAGALGEAIALPLNVDVPTVGRF